MASTDPIPAFTTDDNERPRRRRGSRLLLAAGAGAMTAATLVGCGSGESVDASAQPVATPTAEQTAEPTATPPVEDPGANLDDEPLPEPVPFEAPVYEDLVERFTVDLPADADPEAVIAAWVNSVEDYTNAAGTQNAADSREPTTGIAQHAMDVSQYYGQAMGDSYFSEEAETSDDASRLYYELAGNQEVVTAANIATRNQEGVEPFVQTVELTQVKIDEHYVGDFAEQYSVPSGTFYAKVEISAVPSMSGYELHEYIVDAPVVDDAAHNPLRTSYGMLVKPGDEGWKISKAMHLPAGF